MNYLVKDHAKALTYRIPDLSVLSESYLRLAARRVTSSNLAYIGKRKEAKGIVEEILLMLESGEINDPYTMLWAMDVVGRVYGIAGESRTFDYFTEVWKFYEKVKNEKGRSRLREAQLAVDELRSVLLLDSSNVGFAEELAKKGLDAAIAKEKGERDHPRHVKEINQLLKKFRKE